MSYLPPLTNTDALRFLTVHYAEPHRVYHGTWHLLDVMSFWKNLARQGRWQHPIDAGLALVCHDAVYDPASDANEETSAAMAVDLCHKYGADEGRVRDMVLATKWHAEEIDFTEPDTQLVLDIDLVNLGRSWERYHWAAVSIRLEYGDLSDALWKAGRSEFLRKMLARSAVYRTPHIGDEAAARANMERELRELEASAIR